MIKQVFTVLVTTAVVAAAGSAAYADSCGMFSKDNEAAKSLVEKYLSTVMRSYKCDGDVSFRGIVKEGCDFWYYNDYNNDIISQTASDLGGADDAGYSVKFGDVSFKNYQYTINAEVTKQVSYKESGEAVTDVSEHTFIIEQNGRIMYIVNDISGHDTHEIQCVK